jgi:pyruvate-formate lyase-activating enzyme
MSRLATFLATCNFGTPWCLSPSHPEPLASRLRVLRNICLARRARLAARPDMALEGVRRRIPVIVVDDDMDERK